MNRIFKTPPPFLIPDGTLISPFMNPKDSMSDLGFNLFDGFSLAIGIIEPLVKSFIHIMPHVDQVTYVLEGEVILKMKDSTESAPYELSLNSGEAVLTRKKEFYQIINNSRDQCKLLYMVSPQYLFLKDNDEVYYDDSIVIKGGWDYLKDHNYVVKELESSWTNPVERLKALEKIRIKKQNPKDLDN